MYLNNLLEEVFQDKETPLDLLQKYDLENVLEKTVHSIGKVLSHSPVAITSLVALAPTILLLINTRLARITDPQDKANVEFLMAEVTAHLIKKLMGKCDQPATALKEIKNSLKTASSLYEYNFGALLKLLNYDSLESNYKEDETYWYDWTGKPHELDELTGKLRRQGIIKSVKGFKELFKNHFNPQLRIQFSKDSPPFLIALFDELKNTGLIIPRGGTGHFHPIKVYGVDFENKILIKNEPKAIKKNAKKKPEMWQKIENKAKAVVAPFITSGTPKPPRVRRNEIT